MSMLKAVNPAKTRKRDKLSFSFPLRRLTADKEKAKSKAIAQ
jgi:hypothetical protein